MSIEEVFNTDVVRSRKKSGGEPANDCNQSCAAPKPKLPTLEKIVTDVRCAVNSETGKPWLVQECLVLDELCGLYKSELQGIYELPAIYKAPAEGSDPVTVPSFDGPPLEVLNAVGETLEVYSGGEVPAEMSGSIFCINGELCYLPGNIGVDVPDEVQIGGDEPADDSTVELWITSDGAKTKNPEGIWTSVPNYKGGE